MLTTINKKAKLFNLFFSAWMDAAMMSDLLKDQKCEDLGEALTFKSTIKG